MLGSCELSGTTASTTNTRGIFTIPLAVAAGLGEVLMTIHLFYPIEGAAFSCLLPVSLPRASLPLAESLLHYATPPREAS